MTFVLLYKLLFEAVVRLGIEHHPRVPLANTGAKLQTYFVLTKENAEKFESPLLFYH